jgi:hypothetical protein
MHQMTRASSEHRQGDELAIRDVLSDSFWVDISLKYLLKSFDVG